MGHEALLIEGELEAIELRALESELDYNPTGLAAADSVKTLAW